MRQCLVAFVIVANVSVCAEAVFASPKDHEDDRSRRGKTDRSVQLGPRPFFLLNDMEDGRLKSQLLKCTEGPFERSDFSIGHRGAALQFPEHTRESYEAAARMGAGIVECDVTFTKDLELVCRHAQNDLHTTTNILAIPDLAAKCTTPFRPAVFDAAGILVTPAAAECRTSDITLAEFKTLRRQDGRVQSARPHGRRVHGRHGELPDRPLRRPVERAPADTQGEHRAVQEARRQDDARAQEPRAWRCRSTGSRKRPTPRR